MCLVINAYQCKIIKKIVFTLISTDKSCCVTLKHCVTMTVYMTQAAMILH